MANEGKHASLQWLKELHFLDRAVALRWVREIGELRFLNIATSVAKNRGRGRGRPPAAYPKGIKRALYLWITKQASKAEAPRMAAIQVHAEGDWEGSGAVDVEYLQRRFRQGMDEASEETIFVIAEAAMAEGRDTIRSNPMDREFRDAAEEYRRAYADRLRGLSNPPQRRPALLDIDHEPIERRRRMMRFLEAFEDLLDDEMPISQLAALFGETHQALKEMTKPQI